ncbi:hypothetical protein F3Y22_tig00117021pilonHSYRG00211 [Hibiscus syriacus]|uniref:RNase H type-1 domain-containing protein n=1 Tax=Hibiscus syriacus TaxID=106335 RepID=A0A6A2WI87_HIBSY|nr:hypothetical protein F3Y22_tig00117021pilonHSYRG00211 [Hibiscus syriacus]
MLLSHLQLADDLIIFSNASLGQIRNIKRILRVYEIASGLQLNLGKSKLFRINMENNVLKVWTNKIGCAVGKTSKCKWGMENLYFLVGYLAGGNSVEGEIPEDLRALSWNKNSRVADFSTKGRWGWIGNGEVVYTVKSAEPFSWFKVCYPTPSVPFDVLVNDLSLADSAFCSATQITVEERWLLPPPGFIKVNVDGTMSDSWSGGGIGGIFRDQNGDWLYSFSIAVGQGPPVQAELLAIRHGIYTFLEMECSKEKRLIVEGDCKTALEWVKDPLKCPGPFLNLVRGIETIVKERAIVLRHVGRSVNVKTDELAKQGIG